MDELAVTNHDLRIRIRSVQDRSGRTNYVPPLRSDVDREIRTCAPRTRAAHQPVKNGLRLLSKVLRQVATSQRFTTYGELKDAFRSQLRRLDIRYQQHAFDDVFAIVGSSVPLVHRAAPAPRSIPAEPEHRGFTKAEARTFFERVTKFGRAKVMPVAAASRIDIYAAPPRENWGDHDRY